MNEWLEELKAQMEDHDNVVFFLENSDNVTLEIREVQFDPTENKVRVLMTPIHS